MNIQTKDIAMTDSQIMLIKNKRIMMTTTTTDTLGNTKAEFLTMMNIQIKIAKTKNHSIVMITPITMCMFYFNSI